MNFRALGKNVILKKIQKIKDDSKVVIIQVREDNDLPLYEILEIGYEVSENYSLSIGDHVHIQNHSAMVLNDKEQLFIVNYEKIIVALKKETTNAS